MRHTQPRGAKHVCHFDYVLTFFFQIFLFIYSSDTDANVNVNIEAEVSVNISPKKKGYMTTTVKQTTKVVATS